MPDSLEDLPQPKFEGTVPVDELETDGDNPNSMPEDRFELLADRIEQRGWVGNAIVTDTDGLIADGEHRWRAAREVGLSEVPVKQYDVSDAERRLLRQELNKIEGSHSQDADAVEYDRMLSEGLADPVEELIDTTDDDLEDLLNEVTDPDPPEQSEGSTSRNGEPSTDAPDDPKSPPEVRRGGSDAEEEWEERGTAEDTNEDMTPEITAKVHFESEADLNRFEQELGVQVHRGRMSTWYPEQDQLDGTDKYATTSTDD